MDKLWNSLVGDFFSVELTEKTMDSEEFVKMLESIADRGTGSYDPHITMRANMPEKYQIIFDALEIVCKIGGKTLQDGIAQLSNDYPDKVNALNYQGWGVPPARRPKKSLGEKRATIGMVYKERNNYKNLEETCEELSIDFDKFKRNRAYLNKIDKEESVQHKQHKVCDEKGNKVNVINITVDEHCDIASYMAVLENKIHLNIELNDLENKLHEFIESNYNKHLPIKRVY